MTSLGRSRQSGIVLVVGLVLLISLTLMGVMAVKMTTLDERIAANNQFRTIVFQGAESVLTELSHKVGIEQLDDCDYDGESMPCVSQEYPTGIALTSGEAGESAPVVKADARIVKEREIDLPGSSIGEAGGAVLRMRLYDIEANASLDATNAKARHKAGIGRVIMPVQ